MHPSGLHDAHLPITGPDLVVEIDEAGVACGTARCGAYLVDETS